MSADTPTGSNWSDMLDQIQQSLARILTEIEERQRASNFAAVVASPSEVLAQPAHQPGSEWRRLVTVAANNAAQVEVGLTEADEALQAWLAQAAAVGQALASAGGAGV